MTDMYAVQLAFSDDTARLGLRPGHRERSPSWRPTVDSWPPGRGRTTAARCWSSWSTLVRSSTQILAADPYYSAPGVTITSVQEWNPVTRHHALDGL